MADPIQQFATWMNAAARSKAIVDATAGCLSTVSADRFPEGRMVLLKGFDRKGFVFYTNLLSLKGRSLRSSPRASLTFHWAPLERQVRIQGKTQKVSDAEADAYWRTRPRITQLGAWASRQSAPLRSRAMLIKEVARFARKFPAGAVPRPPHWTGIRVIPRSIEFWEGRANRLHDRLFYTRTSRGWKVIRLYP